MSKKVDRVDLYKFYMKSFEKYEDKNFLDSIFNENLESAENSYVDDDSELREELGILESLKKITYLKMIKRIKEEDDIDTELYLIDSFSYVHNLYVRKNNLEKVDKKYEKAIEKTIDEFDGEIPIASFIYKSISDEYKSKKKVYN